MSKLLKIKIRFPIPLELTISQENLLKYIGKAFHFALILILTALTVKEVYNLCNEYNEKEAKMSLVFNESMAFPNLTFCMTKRHALSHFSLGSGQIDSKMPQLNDSDISDVEDLFVNMSCKQSFLKEAWSPEMVLSVYQLIEFYTSVELEMNEQIKNPRFILLLDNNRPKYFLNYTEQWSKIMAKRNLTFDELAQKLGKEILKRSLLRFERVSYNDDDIFKMETKATWISSQHFCFQPLFTDGQSFKPIEDQGEIFKFVAIHDKVSLKDTQNECISIDFHGRPSTVRQKIEGRRRVNDGIVDALCLEAVHDVVVDVKAQYTMIPNVDPSTACQNYDGDNNIGSANCQRRCQVETLRNLCKCTAHSLAYLVPQADLKRTPLCDYANANCNLADSKKLALKCVADNCLPSCRQIRYDIKLVRKGSSVRKEITAITLVWNSFQYLTLEQSWKYPIWVFLSALGGGISLWLGLSVLSFIQLLTFVLNQTKSYLRGRYKFRNSENTDIKDQNIVMPEFNPGEQRERVRRLSLNPLGGPIAVNPLDSRKNYLIGIGTSSAAQSSSRIPKKYSLVGFDLKDKKTSLTGSLTPNPNERDRKMSLNPFTRPITANPFEAKNPFEFRRNQVERIGTTIENPIARRNINFKISGVQENRETNI